jgi:hypothetical protein
VIFLKLRNPFSFSIFVLLIQEPMQNIEIFSILTITLALVFYSIGIWAERLARYLKKWHLAVTPAVTPALFRNVLL